MVTYSSNRQVISETISLANLLTNAKHSAFSANQLVVIDKTKQRQRTTLKAKQSDKKTTDIGSLVYGPFIQ